MELLVEHGGTGGTKFRLDEIFSEVARTVYTEKQV